MDRRKSLLAKPLTQFLAPAPNCYHLISPFGTEEGRMTKLFSVIWKSFCTKYFIEFERAINRNWVQQAIAKDEITAFTVNFACHSLYLLFGLTIYLCKVWQ